MKLDVSGVVVTRCWTSESCYVLWKVVEQLAPDGQISFVCRVCCVGLMLVMAFGLAKGSLLARIPVLAGTPRKWCRP